MMPCSLSITSFIFPPAIILHTCFQSLIGIFLLHCTLQMNCLQQYQQGSSHGYTMQRQNHSCPSRPSPARLWLLTEYPQSTEYRALHSYRVPACTPATCIIRHVLRCRNRFLRTNPLWRLIHTQLKS